MSTLEKITNRENIAEVPEIRNFTKIIFYLRQNNINWRLYLSEGNNHAE